MVAFLVQFGVTIRAYQKVRRNLVMTYGADLPLFNILEHRLARQLALILFGERLARAQNHVQNQTGQIKHHDQRDRQNLRENVTRAGSRIAKRPNYHRDPNCK